MPLYALQLIIAARTLLLAHAVHHDTHVYIGNASCRDVYGHNLYTVVWFLLCPSGAVAKYCDERVCVSVCLSVSPRGYIRNHTVISTQFLCMLHGRSSVLLRHGDEITRKRGNFGIFFPVDNTLYSIAFGIHRKTAEPIKMPFGTMSELGPRNSVLRGGDDRGRVKGNFWGNMWAKILTTLWITNWTGPCSGLHTTGADSSLQALDESIMGSERGLHTAGEVWYLWLPYY